MEVNVSLKKFWLALIPATFAAISFILVIISITAGHSAGVMEDYHILYVGELSSLWCFLRSILTQYLVQHLNLGQESSQQQQHERPQCPINTKYANGHRSPEPLASIPRFTR